MTTGSNGKTVDSNGDEGEYAAFKRRYLAAYFCASASDWLKGPYIYRLYEAGGFTSQDITVLFTSGYVSSAIFGAIAGMLCDAFGRRRTCLAFCGIYITHALLHFSSNFWVLLTARLFSGVATALLSCAFEAWLVSEHRRRFPVRDLAEVFSLQTQGNALMAMASGLAAQAIVGATGDYGSPFCLAVPLLLSCAGLVWSWPENRGSQKKQVGAVFHSAVSSMSSVVVRVGLLQCLFEGSMHVFVFLWTPCLHRGDKDNIVPHGLVFALYMAAMAVGGRQAKLFGVVPPLGVVFAIAAAVLAVPMLTANLWCNLGAFCTFEWCCGCYFPQIAMLRSRHLAEHSRAATITIFRIPLNGIVVAALLWGRAWPCQYVLLFASLALATGGAIWCTLSDDAPAVVQGAKKVE